MLFLYLFDLSGVGFLGPDEPRYASIGRAMTVSHDFITPRLDGEAWFEKPPLLYWMIAAGHALRLPDELAARLPVELVSICFLIFFFNIVAREFSDRLAIFAATILATSAGWLTYSFVAVTDLPMSALLAAAMMIALFDSRPAAGYVAGGLLGLSVLAKGLVPLVLFAPVLLIIRGKRWTTILSCALVASPWYLLCAERNGSAFWNEFFWKQHFERFFTSSLEHVQPWWFYLPILLAALFPWIPLAGVLFRRKTFQDVRVRFFAGWLLYALVFFSASKNKLPGYVLPLLPALAIVLAFGLEKTGAKKPWWMAASMLTLIALPVITYSLPAVLLDGIRKAPLVLAPGLPFLLAVPMVWYLAWREKPAAAMLAAGAAVFVGLIYFKLGAFPLLDRQVSVRGFWRANRDQIAHACFEPDVRREWQYGLNYYAGHALPDCRSGQAPEIAAEHGQLIIGK